MVSISIHSTLDTPYQPTLSSKGARIKATCAFNSVNYNAQLHKLFVAMMKGCLQVLNKPLYNTILNANENFIQNSKWPYSETVIT